MEATRPVGLVVARTWMLAAHRTVVAREYSPADAQSRCASRSLQRPRARQI
jgi:hypothetical protein